MDCIIVLGKTLGKDTWLVPECKKRVDHGIQLHREHGLPLIMSSGHAYNEKRKLPTIAFVMKEYAISQGVLEDDIFMEDKSVCTLSNAWYCKKMFSFSSPVVVTDQSHMPRSRYIFSRFYPNATFVTAPHRLGVQWFFYELRGWLYSWFLMKDVSDLESARRRWSKWHVYYKKHEL
jgi:uncharacterized SAM-binding protein YcdF (DUF218 family)